jgi:hypothetical protein
MAITLEQVREIITAIVRPAHFYVGPGLELAWEYRASEEIAWEIYRGRLLPPGQTREKRSFAASSIRILESGVASAHPLLSLKLDTENALLHVVRGLRCYVWEPYDSGSNVILSRETIAWVPELVGTLRLDGPITPEEFRQEIAHRITDAVVGASRLPLSSAESPLPAFSLGQLAYCDRPMETGRPCRSWREWIRHVFTEPVPWKTTIRGFDFLLRAIVSEEIPEAAAIFAECLQEKHDLPRLFRDVFNETSLSPWTRFAKNALAFAQRLLTMEEQADFLSHLLRQLGRHLTAYDLMTFHHNGANYPDALLLDLALQAMLRLIEIKPELFSGEHHRLRRRGLRQGCLLRRFYEGHPVPDAPTSPGENTRVLPLPHVRVPEEQITNPATRRKRLFDGDPLVPALRGLARQVLQQSLQDLRHAAELRECGLGIFIDRPMSVGKAPGEPDQTPLLSYLAFSRTVAARRLTELGLLAREAGLAFDVQQDALRTLPMAGLPVRDIPPGRPPVSLADAGRVAADFVLLETLPASLKDWLALFDWTDLARTHDLRFLEKGDRLLVVPSGRNAAGEPRLTVFDSALRRRLELEANLSAGFDIRRGIEFPVNGLGIVRLWRENTKGELMEHAWTADAPIVPVRSSGWSATEI